MSSLLTQALTGQPLEPEIIDMHGHIRRYDFTIPDITGKSIVKSMDRLGIKSIVCSHMQCMSTQVELGNQEIHQAMQGSPGRILGYVALYPFRPEQVKSSVEQWLERGFTGLKLHNINGFPYADLAYQPAYAIAHERHLPILFHTWGQAQEFKDLKVIAKAHPNASLLLAHTGSNDLEGYIAMTQEYPNIYLELCLSLSPRGLVAELVEKAGSEKIVWGSDCLFLNQAQQLGRVIGADIPDEDKKKILGGNARKILGKIKK